MNIWIIKNYAKSLFIIITSFLHLFSLDAKNRIVDESCSTNYPYYFPAVNHQYKFVWFRVHKVATSTMNQIFKRNNVSFPIFIRHPSREHLDIRSYKNYFRFGFVRNPWDRVVSCYINRVVGKNTAEHSDLKECFDKDFDYFVDFLDRQDLTQANRHVMLQTALIPVGQVDFIGKLENFSEDLQYVLNQIGLNDREIKKNKGIPKANATKHKHYSQFYTKRTQAIIARKYKDDIEAFGYEFEYNGNSPF